MVSNAKDFEHNITESKFESKMRKCSESSLGKVSIELDVASTGYKDGIYSIKTFKVIGSIEYDYKDRVVYKKTPAFMKTKRRTSYIYKSITSAQFDQIYDAIKAKMNPAIEKLSRKIDIKPPLLK